MSRAILHIDMDAFFAAVEQHDFPEFMGKPVIVGADPKKGKGRGVVAAASYEARRYGIHSAMPIVQAYRRCPHGVFRPPRGKRYSEISDRIMNLFQEYTPLVEAISLDEAFLDVTGMERLKGNAVSIGKEIKSRIKTQEGLTASAGIAPNKLLAKIASDLDKPDGFVVIGEGEVRSFLEPLPIKRLWGIGKKTEEHLNRMGIRTIGEIAVMPKETLESHFGKMGLHLWRCAQGIDDRPVESSREAKSISNEMTYLKDEDDPAVHRETLLQLAEKVGYRLRKGGWMGRTVTIKVRTEDFTTMIRHTTLNKPTNQSEAIYKEAIRLYHNVDLKWLSVRLLGVGMTQLVAKKGGQGDLFKSMDLKRERATNAADELKQKYGYGVIGKSHMRLRQPEDLH